MCVYVCHGHTRVRIHRQVEAFKFLPAKRTGFLAAELFRDLTLERQTLQSLMLAPFEDKAGRKVPSTLSGSGNCGTV